MEADVQVNFLGFPFALVVDFGQVHLATPDVIHEPIPLPSIGNFYKVQMLRPALGVLNKDLYFNKNSR